MSEKAIEPDIKPVVLFVQATGASLSLCVEGPKYERKFLEGTNTFNEKKVQDARYLDIPGYPTKMRVTAENVKNHGFDSVPVMLKFLQNPAVMLGPQGHPLFVYSLSLGEQTTFTSDMDEGALRKELAERTNQKPNRDISRVGAIKALRGLRALCNETCEAPNWVAPEVVVATDVVKERSLTDEVLAHVRRD